MATQKNALVYYGPRNSTDPVVKERERRIQELAYYKAMNRHFAPGHELEDWLDAEEEVDAVSQRHPDS